MKGGAPNQITIPADVYRQTVQHVRDLLPREAVGLLAGSAEGHVELVVPLPNIASGDKRFIADPLEQFLAFRRLKSEGLELLALYHSHPDGGTDPSEEDLLYARQWRCAHIIVAASTETQSIKGFGAFRYLATGVIEEVQVQLPRHKSIAQSESVK